MSTVISLLFTASVFNPAIDSTTVTITQLDRTTTTLGRRGQRITETWLVTVGNATATIDFAPYHSRIANTPKPHQTGDQVELSLTANQKTALTAGGTVHLTINAVKN